MLVTLAQLNPVVGDVEGNLHKALETLEANQRNSDLLVFPEMYLAGYPAQDLLNRPSFLDRIDRALVKIRKATAKFPEIALLVGAPERNERPGERRIFNSAFLFARGETLLVQRKTLLPTYDVFDEGRYFQPATGVSTTRYKGETLGVSVCEDAWTNEALWPRGTIYNRDPLAELSRMGATLMINISASPFSAGKEKVRRNLLADHARRHNVPVVVVNQVGGNDELIFDGRSMCFDPDGKPIHTLGAFVEEVVTVDTAQKGTDVAFIPQDEIASIHDALVFGLQDYARKCSFEKAIIGLSGGIDSAVTLAVAVKAFGSENVLALSMPSRYSSAESVAHAQELGCNLSVDCRVISIDAIFRSYLETLGSMIDTTNVSVTLENMQARIRGNILMATANETGALCLATGNKSELAVGYCTLYGDMSGGLSVLADVPKTRVYHLAEYVNRSNQVIPRAIIEKPPSAELRPGQMDQDSLPPYETLDDILAQYIEEVKSPAEIVASGHDSETVRWVVRAVNTNEYKRRQAAPGLRVTSKSFGGGRRMPIAARFENFDREF